jgi:serine/threonine-protein kinase
VKIATTKPKSIDEHAPSVPESVRAVVRACLEPNLAQRAQSFEQVQQMLKAAMNEIEFSDARLPPPTIAAAVVDPDATNALPVMRASDRPPPVMGEATIPSHPPVMSITGSGSIPPAMGSGPTGPSWHTSTPNTSYASINVPGPQPSKAPWFVAGGAMTLAAALAVGIVVIAKQKAPAVTATTSATSAVIKMNEPAPSPPPPESTSKEETPTMSVDALPQASSLKPATGPVTRGYGRVFVSASPGWCTVSVDGKEKGPTPIAGMDVGAGMHTLTCKTPSGKTKSMVVNVIDGQTAKQKFALDD